MAECYTDKKGVHSVAVNTAKEELHRLVDALPDEEAAVAKRFLQWLLAEGGEEALTPEEIAEAEAGWQEYLEGKARPWSEVRKELARE